MFSLNVHTQMYLKKKVIDVCWFQFRVHASHYYQLMCETMSYDLKHELRSIMKKFFIHVGLKSGIIHPDRRTNWLPVVQQDLWWSYVIYA